MTWAGNSVIGAGQGEAFGSFIKVQRHFVSKVCKGGILLMRFVARVRTYMSAK